MSLRDELAAEGRGQSNNNHKSKVPDGATLRRHGWNVPDNFDESVDPTVVRKPALRVTKMSDVNGEEIKWLWQDRIARGKVHLGCGQPGIGKSYCLTVDWPAIITTGRDWPDGAKGPEPSDVLILAAEDGLADTLRPRFDAAGADVNRIFVLQSRRLLTEEGEAREAQIELGRDIEEIDAFLESNPAISTVVIDPVTEFMGAIDGNSNTEVRAKLTPLVQLAERRGVAILCVSHFNKSSTGPALFRALGSVAFTAVARIAWAFIHDREDEERILVLPLKCNISRTAPGLAFRIVDGRLEWEAGEVHITADEALVPLQRGKQPEKLDEAVEWLKGQLADGCKESSQLDKDAAKVRIAKRTLWRARKELGARATKGSLDGKWYVSLPDEAMPLSRVHNIDGMDGRDGSLEGEECQDRQARQLFQGGDL